MSDGAQAGEEHKDGSFESKLKAEKLARHRRQRWCDERSN